MSENGSETEKTTISDKITVEEDEQIQSMSVSAIDPAILCCRERSKVSYSRDQLFLLSKSPFSKIKPDFWDLNEVSPSILDPEKWNLERKKSESLEAGPKGNENGDRRRSGDPRERIRKENDGIVLSPQRRSFNTGCFVPANKEPLIAAKGDAPPHIMGVREIGSSTRRIGSGRIIREAWDNEKELVEPELKPEYNFGRGGAQGRNNDRDDKYDRGDKYERGDRGMREEVNKFERRSFGREYREDDRNNVKEGRRNTRYSETRRSGKEDEPEWFSCGPISQNDTIELRGFDEPEKLKKKPAQSRIKRREFPKRKDEIAEEKEKEGNDPKARSTPKPQDPRDVKAESKDKNEAAPKAASGDQPSKKGSESDPSQSNAQGGNMFDFDEFLKGENIPGLLPNGANEDAEKSRFSRWFKKESPKKETADSRRSSIQEDNHIIKDLLKDINESSSIPVTIHAPMDSNTYFAPISPAGNTPSGSGGIDNLMRDKAQQHMMGRPINIMDMLGGGKQPPQQPPPQTGWAMKPQGPSVGSGKILSLDEIEGKIRQTSDHSSNMPQKPPQQKPNEEMSAAFKKLLQQAGVHSSQNGPVNKGTAGPPMSLMEMLNHSQQQDEARFAAAQAVAANHQLMNAMHVQQPPPINDLTMKLQQAQLQHKQMDMLGKLMAGNVGTSGHMRSSPLMDMGTQQSRELLNRPEAQAILQGLKRGEITIQHLYQQLANPALQPRHRDMLISILKLHGNSGNSASYGPSPRVLSPVPLSAHHLYPPQQQAQMQQQQLRVSPLQPNAMHQRIPSPRELHVHTHNILQRAMIKKRLEEQTENFRKKEMQRVASPNPAGAVTGGGIAAALSVNQQSGGKGLSSPTPLAFTPTSVLRKMTADKDEGKENKAISDNTLKQQGRALTGTRPPSQANSQQWNPAYPMKQAGRPIVKANNYQSQTPDQFFAQLAAQQQPMPQQRTYQAVPSAPHRKPIIGQQYPSQGSQYGPTQNQFPHPNPQSSFPQPTAQQLRAQHQHRPSNNATAPTQPTPQQPINQGMATQPQQSTETYQQAPQQGSAAWQQFLSSAAHQNSSRPALVPSRPNQQSGGVISPSTADQLTRWFSPDLLERARVGELPSTANLARLEEIERKAAPPVHN